MKILELLNSVHRDKDLSKFVSLDSILLPPIVREGRIYSLVTNPIIKSIQSKNFTVMTPYLLLVWDFKSKTFLEKKELQRIKNSFIEFKMPYKHYSLKYIEYCNELDKNKPVALEKYFSVNLNGYITQ